MAAADRSKAKTRPTNGSTGYRHSSPVFSERLLCKCASGFHVHTYSETYGPRSQRLGRFSIFKAVEREWGWDEPCSGRLQCPSTFARQIRIPIKAVRAEVPAGILLVLLGPPKIASIRSCKSTPSVAFDKLNSHLQSWFFTR